MATLRCPVCNVALTECDSVMRAKDQKIDSLYDLIHSRDALVESYRNAFFEMKAKLERLEQTVKSVSE